MTPSNLESRAERQVYAADDRDEELANMYGGGERARASVEHASKAAAAAASPRLAFVPIGEFLANVTAPKWLIRDIVESDSLLMIFGDPESGKSFLAMDWAASVATGREWNGFPVKQGPVLYINGEGRNGVSRRFSAWKIANGCALEAAPLFLSTVSTALTDGMGRAELEAVVAEFVAAYGAPALIVIDTLARNYGPGDENSTQDMTAAVATCDSLREMTQATIALVHHSGHGDKNRARGSMVLRGALDAEYRMTRTEGGDTMLESTKMKDAEHPQPMAFKFAQVELGLVDDDDRMVTSAVLRRTEMPQPGDEGEERSGGRPHGRGQPPGRGKHQTRALEILLRLHAEHVTNVMRAGRNPSEAHVHIETWRDNCIEAGIPRNRFNDLRQTLVNTRKVRIDLGFVTPLADA
ncbi:AAA family ATPase [Lysobacter sp. K5869]|uniref:helicase RepA family protein n=1 Tax=Lysobacter sp. K5869 TaxID=2820808 RepID=UPI001C062278|nr:helicase RepA family protein [Lysobacter sp. K5869]QWP79211.1 AAA family ATPase [Lysobacter sp. K5869]